MARENPQRILVLLAMAALLGYGGLLFEHLAAGVGGSDSSGYANTARDLLGGRVVVPLPVVEELELPERFAWAFIPLGYEAGPQPRTMTPLYPSGFPLHLALAALIAGWEAGPFVVSPILGLLAVVLMLRMNLRHPRPYQAAIEHGTFPEGCLALAARAAGGKALVVSMEFSGALRFYTNLTPLRWDALSAEDFALVRARAAEKGYRVFAALMPHEIEGARPRVPGDWVFPGNVRRAGLFELARAGELGLAPIDGRALATRGE